MSSDRRVKVEMVLLTGNSHVELAEKIASRIKPLGICKVYRKSNLETRVDIKESVRGKDVFIIQTGTTRPNDDIMELLMVAYACKTACARKLVGVVPYLPYSRQSKVRNRGAIPMKLIARLLAEAGLCHLITVDLHQREIQGFFDFPVDNLRSFPFIIDYISKKVTDCTNAVIVARHPSQAKRANLFAIKLRLSLAVIHGSVEWPESKDDYSSELFSADQRKSESVDRKSEPSSDLDDHTSGYSDQLLTSSNRSSASLYALEACEQTPSKLMDIVGDVNGRIAIMMEDIVDDMTVFAEAARILKHNGAYKIYVMATHGLFGPKCINILENSFIDELIVTNSIPHALQKMQCCKIKTVDISALLSEAIRRIHNLESMSYLFRDAINE
ncbi:hypothetical protein GJ496_008150 [Pomphorhynchus laevis]|nr:hypothetical protein GJ496_008150 [Pomphorhynchus laevis]